MHGLEELGFSSLQKAEAGAILFAFNGASAHAQEVINMVMEIRFGQSINWIFWSLLVGYMLYMDLAST